jgi:hypothetical protein
VSGCKVRLGEFTVEVDPVFDEDVLVRVLRGRRVLTLPSSIRVFFAVEPIDMRGSFDALARRVRRMNLDPGDGHL